MRAFLGAFAGAAGITLASLAVDQKLLAPWWLYAVFVPLGAVSVVFRSRTRTAGRHRA